MNRNLGLRHLDDRAWRLFLFAGAGFAATIAIVPAGLGADVLYAAGNAVAAVAVGIGIHRNRPSSLLAWRLIFAAAMVQFGLNLVRAIGTGWPSIVLPERVLETAFLVPYALITIGLWSLARSGAQPRARWAIIDSIIVAVGLGLGSFLFALTIIGNEPDLFNADVVGSFIVSLPAVALTGWLALTPGPGRISVGLLLAGAIAQATGDGLLGTAFVVAGPAPEPAWMLSLVLYGAAALHPALARPTDRPLVGSSFRPVLLGVAILVPTLADTVHHLGGVATGVALDVVSTSVTILAVARIVGLFHVLEVERHLEATARTLAEEVIATSPGMVAQGRVSDGTIHYASPALQTVLGYRPEEVVDVPGWWPNRFHPDDRERFLRAVRKASAMGEAATEEVRMRHADGSYRNILIASRWKRSSDGTPDAFLATGMDVTAWRAAQNELSAATGFLADVVQSTPVVFLRGHGPERVVDYVSPNFQEVLGFRPGEVIGAPGWPIRLIHPDDREAAQADIATSIGRREERYTADLRVLTAAGETRTMLVTIRRTFADDETWQFTGTLLDITERREVEDALRRAKEEAERANRAKSEFLSGVSHELRTPLNAVLGFGQLLDRADLPGPDDRDAVAQILRGGHRLLEMIDSLLELARMDAGRITLSIEPVSVDEVIHDAVDLVRPAADARGIALRVPEDDPSAWVLADARRLKQVLLNLLSNAVRYGPTGSAIVIRREPGAATGRWRISVADSGPGIEPDLQERLFTPFRRGSDTGDLPPGGLGVGLAISAGLVEAMAGTIGVDSAPGRGSTFHVELPGTLAPVEADEAGADAPRPTGEGSGWTIVYIEDNLPNLGLVERILTARPGTRLLAAMQGRLGIDLVRQHDADLVLLDLHLPDITGEEVLEALDADPRTREIPVLVLSSSTEPGLRRRLRDLGADEFLAKPLDVGEFLDTVDRLVAWSTPAEG